MADNYLKSAGEIDPSPYTYIVYREGTTYYAKSNTLTNYSNTNPAVVLQAAITPGRDVYVSGGDYVFPAGFSSILFPADKVFKVMCADDAKFIVPNGYADAVFKFKAVNRQKFFGGRFEEAGTPARNWYPVELKADGTGGAFTGCLFNIVGGYETKDAKALVKMGVYTNDAWLNGNTVRDLTGWRCKYVIEFYKDAAVTGGATYKHIDNKFQNIEYQTDVETIIGVKDIQGEGNVFRDIMVWDLQTGASGANTKSCNILDATRWTRIEYGTLADSLIADPTQDQSSAQDTIIKTWNGATRYPKLDYSPFTEGTRRGWISGIEHQYGGLLQGGGAVLTGTIAPTKHVWFTHGNYIKFTSGNVANDRAGYKFDNLTARALNPRLRLSYNLDQVIGGQTRGWFGFTSNTGQPTGNTAADAHEVFMIGFRTTDTNLQVIHNDAGTPAIYNDTGKSANTTSIQHLEIMADATNNRWLWRINTGGWTAVTTDIPAATTILGLVYGIQIQDTTPRAWNLLDLDIKVDSK